MSQLAAPGRSVSTSRAAAVRHPRQAPRPARRPTAPRSTSAAPARTGRVAAVTGARQGGSGFMLLVGAVALFGVLALLFLNTMRAEQSFTVSRLQSDVTTLQQRQQQLQSDLSSVSAPENLAVRADALGMVKAASVKYVRAGDHKTLGVAKVNGAGEPLNVETLPDTPASKVASQMLADGAIGTQITEPQAAAAAQAKHKTAEKKASDQAKAAKSVPSGQANGKTSGGSAPKH